MLFWTLSLLMCAAGIMLVLWPLSRRPPMPDVDGEGLEFYRAQLTDIEARIAAGQGDAMALEEERTEVARRILKADRQKREAGEKSGSFRTSRTVASLAAIIAIPALTFSLYAMQGSPTVPDKPLAAVQAQSLSNQSVEQLVKRAEDHLAKNPDDPKGWQVLARVYERMNRPVDRARALRNLIRLKGPTADLMANLGEAIAVADQNVISRRARDLFQQALLKEPNHRKARFYFALSLEQEGKFDEAMAMWINLAKLNPDNAEWQSMIKSRMDIAASNGASRPARGPTDDDVKAAASMSVKERQAMIEGMVANLAERLEDEPQDIAGWQRLINAYAVLKQRENALASLNKAEAHFTARPEALAKLAALRQQLGLPKEETR